MIPFVLLMSVQVKRAFIRYETASLLKQSQFQQIILNESDLVWEEEGKELWVNGKLFDIESSTRAVDGFISFKGLFDEKETALNAQVDNMLNSKKATLLLLAKIISLQSPSEIHSQSHQNQIGESIQYSFIFFEQAIQSRSLKKVGPPPKLLV